MKMTFRWYGKDDPVTLDRIRQIPKMTGVVSAVYSVPAGGLWPEADIAAIKTAANEKGLEFEVVESVPVHEDIKLGAPGSDKLIEIYGENLRRLAKAGVRCVCYNFMPVFDWLRSDLSRALPDGSRALAYDDKAVLSLDPVTSDLSLPGWDESYSKDELRALIARYADVGEAGLWKNLGRFLSHIIPICDETGITMAIHPDDPPWGIFGLPRIITGAESYQKLFSLAPSAANGLTLCTGSLGADPANRLAVMARDYGAAGRIHFVHARNILYTGERSFEEAAHPTGCGSLDMYAILKALHDAGFGGYMRPDHGRMIWGEQGRPGYGLYDRALGATYLTGLWEAIERSSSK